MLLKFEIKKMKKKIKNSNQENNEINKREK